MKASQFNKEFQENKRQAITFHSEEGYTERAIITSGIVTSTTGNSFVRITRHRYSSVNLTDIKTLITIGNW